MAFVLAALALSSVLGPRSTDVDPASYVGNVYGTITDRSGKPAPNVPVFVAGRIARTDGNGAFLINSIPAPYDGLDYIVTVANETYNVHVLPGATMALELNVQLGVSANWHYRHETEDRGPRTEDKAVENFTRMIFATREGLVGGTTANGHVIVTNDHFVALPSRRALSTNFGHEREVRVTYQGRTTIAPVWDIGPWNTHDDYWNPSQIRETFRDLPRGKPEAEAANLDGYNDGRDERGRIVVTPAGIDLADGTFRLDLALPTNDWVEVEYLWLDTEGPIVSDIVVFPGTFTAQVSDASPIDAAEFFIDTTGDPGNGTPANVLNGVVTAPLPQLAPGTTHTISVRARDAYGNWGALTSVTVTIPPPPPKRRSVRH
jgi:hypothetical protein